MRPMLGKFAPLVLAIAFALPVLTTGCAVQARVYDPYYHDYHPWNGEVVYYGQWERDTHRDHVEFNARNDADKKAYWDWRHSHGDNH
jgi:hypothetical protein